MSYQVPQHIDPNKVFLVNLSQLEGRLDPSVYKPHFSFVSKKYKNAKLSEIAWIDPLCNFGECNEVSFIPMDAIDSANGTVAYQGTKKVENSKGFTRFREGDILWAKITPCMQNAKSAIAKNLLNGFGCGSTEFYVIRTKDENIVRQEYLLFLLRDERILKTAMNFFGGSAGQQRVSSIFLKTFNVPIPSIQEQKNICDILAKYSSLKQQQEQQAEALLQSIDGYLLNELGIQLPETKSQTIQDRMFVVNFSELSGDRLDPMFYTSQFSNIVAKLHDSATCKRLGQIAHFSSEIWNQRDYYEKEFPYIEIGAINITDGTIEDVSFVPVEQAPSRAKVIVRTGDIIISTTRPDRGAIIKITENENLYIASTGFSVIRNIDSNINPDYLLAILRHKLILMQMRQRTTGGNYPAITQAELSKIIIPILPIRKQQEIVDHISSIRQQAKALQEEGKAILEQAKKEVEHMILG